jgi:hypothetical protein
MLLRIAIFNVVFKTGYLGFQSRFLNMHLTLFYVAVYQCIFSGLIYRFCHEKNMCFMHFILIGILYNLTSQNAGNRTSGTLNFKTFPGVHVCPQIPLRCLPSPALDNPPTPTFYPGAATDHDGPLRISEAVLVCVNGGQVECWLGHCRHHLYDFSSAIN